MGNCKSKNSKQKIKLNHEKYNNQENRMIENKSQNEKEINLNHEKYKPNILLGQKILIVMLYNDSICNINAIFYNGKNKTVKDAVSHFGIEIYAVDSYERAITELTKNENGKCPYYACWVLNYYEIKNNTNQFLEILIKFWRNGGAVVLFSDNSPYIVETNLFLSKINVDFIMDGDYIGEKKL